MTTLGLRLPASLSLSPTGLLSDIWARVPAPPINMTMSKLSALEPSRRRPTRAKAVDQREDQGTPETSKIGVS